MKIGVRSESGEVDARAVELAQRLGLPYAHDNAEAEIILWVSGDEGFSLSLAQDSPNTRLHLSFHSGALNHRRMYGGGKSQMIAKAVGIEKGVYPSIIDATAGLGGDAFVLAALGATVFGVEKNPILFALLDDAKTRAREYAESNDPELSEVLKRLEFAQADSCDYLASAKESFPEVIYLDPMFP
ncbi:UNVERIFIED_CONTAM: hypothetical protein GTU68_044159, partial [Idotea baltica]|nr:hypothetical protein [Idotea baltica]